MSMSSIDANVNDQSSVNKDMLQQTAAKIGVRIPEHLEDDFATMLAGAKVAMDKVMVMDGINSVCTTYQGCQLINPYL